MHVSIGDIAARCIFYNDGKFVDSSDRRNMFKLRFDTLFSRLISLDLISRIDSSNQRKEHQDCHKYG